MNILAIDTATEACSVAIMLDDKRYGNFALCPQKQSQNILPMIDELLKQHELSLSDMNLLAYARGPGSFTGVRIAASTIQGLALGSDLPVVEISTLATMAQQAYEQYQKQRCVAMIDARMNEVYFAAYEMKQGLMQACTEELVLSPELVCKQNRQHLETEYFVGTGFDAYADAFQSEQIGVETGDIQILYPNALYMLDLAKYAYDQGAYVAVDSIQPVYVRDTVTWKKLPNK